MDNYETTSDLNEAIYYDRLDVDMEMASLEAAGNAYARRMIAVEALLKSGQFEAAVRICQHGHVGGLTGSCTDTDPRHGQEGYRCYECGAHVDEMGGTVLHTR